MWILNKCFLLARQTSPYSLTVNSIKKEKKAHTHTIKRSRNMSLFVTCLCPRETDAGKQMYKINANVTGNIARIEGVPKTTSLPLVIAT